MLCFTKAVGKNKMLWKFHVHASLSILILFLILYLLPVNIQPDFPTRSQEYLLIGVGKILHMLGLISVDSFSNHLEGITCEFFGLRGDFIKFSFNCIPNVNLFLERIILFFINTSPILLSLIFIKEFRSSSLIFISPAFVYYLSLLSHESFLMSLQILFCVLYIYRRNFIVQVIILLSMPLIDVGNSLVFIAFVVFDFISTKIRNKIFIIFFIIILFVYILSPLEIKNFLFSQISHITGYQKFNNVANFSYVSSPLYYMAGGLFLLPFSMSNGYFTAFYNPLVYVVIASYLVRIPNKKIITLFYYISPLIFICLCYSTLPTYLSFKYYGVIFFSCILRILLSLPPKGRSTFYSVWSVLNILFVFEFFFTSYGRDIF